MPGPPPFWPTGVLTLSLSVRKIVISGLLGAIAILLAVTRWGFIPVPNVSGNATILHVPAILGGVLEGPWVGLIVGAIFGVFSWVQATNALFANPPVSVLPRLFIGVVAYYAFVACKPMGKSVAYIVAGVVGTLTNTVLVLGSAILLKLLPAAVVLTIVPQAVAEVIIAAIITLAVGLAASRMYGAGGASKGMNRAS